jgi:hypothetical protein
VGARAAAIAVLLVARAAGADEAGTSCRPLDPRGRTYAACFDPGNRLVLGGDVDLEGPWFEAGIQLRHDVPTEDPAVRWRFEHRGLVAEAGVGRFEGLLYSGRFLRHSRDGHLVLPTNPPRKIFLPFDVGAEVTLGRVRGVTGAPDVRVDVVRTVAMIDLARSEDFRRRLALGPVAEWDVLVTREDPEIQEHLIVPFTAVQLGLYAEDRRGLTHAQVALEGGARWSNATGWGRRLAAEASLERVFVAVNDRPVSVYLAGRWDEPDGFLAHAGLRLALISSAR